MKKLMPIILSIAILSSCKKSYTASPTTPVTNPPPPASNVHYKTVYTFNNGINAMNPYGSLIVSGTTLYGMSYNGGTNNSGCIFSYDTNGKVFTDIHDFKNNATDGGLPDGDLTLSGTTLYGMTWEGGTSDNGTIFSINTTGTGYTILYNFSSGASGANPHGDLTLSGTMLYGMTQNGGAGGGGNIFSFNTVGNVYTDLFDFDYNGSFVYTNGQWPLGSLTLSGNTLYGMTSKGGANNDGVIFTIGTNGSGFTILLAFNNTNGSGAQGNLLLSGSTLYGMAQGGGANSGGCIFSIGTSGSGYTDMYDFPANASTGWGPTGSLILSGSTLYGMANEGGPSGNSEGTIFSIGTNGSGFKFLADFGNDIYGTNPWGSLVLFDNTLLYGMTYGGVTNSPNGTIFSYSL